jgi:ribonuclease HI
MAKKVYAVKKGCVPGIYYSWEECKEQVEGYPNAQFKGFTTEEDALRYLNGENESISREKSIEYIAYVDGSYNAATKEYSCGVVILHNGTIIKEISQKGPKDEAASMRNVAGEILGAKIAIQYCLDNNIKEIDIYHDYAGIAHWANNEWKTNNEWTMNYRHFVFMARKKCNIKFVKVKGHSGDQYNEMVDRLAKDALGIK